MSDKRLSYTSLATYFECPRKWDFIYNLNLQSPSGRGLQLGSCIHWLLDKYYTKENLQPDQPYSDEIIAIANKYVAQYIKFYGEEEFEILDSESSFSFKRKDQIWSGKIDLIFKKNNKVYIMDHKYSSRRFNESFFALDFQGAIYFYYLTYIKNLDITGIIWNTIYGPNKLLKSGNLSDTVEFRRFTTYKTEREIERAWEIIDAGVAEINSNVYLPHISRINCEMCPFIEQCILKQKGLDDMIG